VDVQRPGILLDQQGHAGGADPQRRADVERAVGSMVVGDERRADRAGLLEGPALDHPLAHAIPGAAGLERELKADLHRAWFPVKHQAQVIAIAADIKLDCLTALDDPRHAIFPADHRRRTLAHAIQQAVGLKGEGGVGADLKNQASVGLQCVHLHSSLTVDVAARRTKEGKRAGWD
jgi:hypothetical protein